MFVLVLGELVRLERVQGQQEGGRRSCVFAEKKSGAGVIYFWRGITLLNG